MTYARSEGFYGGAGGVRDKGNFNRLLLLPFTQSDHPRNYEYTLSYNSTDTLLIAREVNTSMDFTNKKSVSRAQMEVVTKFPNWDGGRA